MVENNKHHQVLAIGFLNDLEKNGQMIESYLEAFDIVILGDGPLTPINMILQNIAGSNVDSQGFEQLEKFF
jgi:hypothetical protein